MKNTLTYILFLTLVVPTCLMKPTHILYASTVINNISVSSHSGGNTAKNGEVVEGKTKSSVDSTTIINGKVVEDIHKESSGEYVHVEHTVVANGTSSNITTNVDLGETKQTYENTVEPLVRHPVETVAIAKPTESIISTNEKIDDIRTTLGMEETGQLHLLSRIFFTFSKTFTYVLSNIFS